MTSNTHSEKDFVFSTFEKTLLEYSKENAVLLSYCGELTQNTISGLEEKIENIISELQIAKGPLKKIFFISVETLQNMLLHGQRNHEGQQHNFFILKKDNNSIKIISANLVSNISIEGIKENINTINSFEDDKALKSYYLEHLENNSMSEKGGAGLGFITIGMKSGNKLVVDFSKINDDFSLFTLISTVTLG